MAKVLFHVDVRRRAALHEKLLEQQPRRVALGERSFELYVDDNARHIGYVLLGWESLLSAHRFLESQESHVLVGEWPVEKVLAATALQDIGETLAEISARKTDA
jgi:hypothetical protein